MNIEELRNTINCGELTIDDVSTPVIERGYLKNTEGDRTDFYISHGWNIVNSVLCDNTWTASRLNLFDYIEKQNYDEKYLEEVLSSIQMEDEHWDWYLKSIRYSSNEYNWFYLIAQNKPQGVCLIYHPKESSLDKSDIFYVEYVATAPWNRDCLIRKKEYAGVGTILLKCALKFAVEILKLSPGFSLHSLSQSQKYYEKLNLVNVKSHNKENLIYFELPKVEAEKLLGKV